MHDLSSARQKLDRASQYLDQIDGCVRDFISTHPYSTDTQIEKDGREWAFSVQLEKKPPSDLGLLIGDYIHNLRGALDHLAWQLAGRPTDPRTARQVQFPISTKRANAVNQLETSLPGVDESAKRIIDNLQPYHLYEPSLPGVSRLPNVVRELDLIQQLSNWDKHREIALSGLSLMSVTGRRRMDPIEEEVRLGPFEDGAVVARFLFEEDPAPWEVIMEFSVTIRLPEPQGFIELLSALHGMQQFVANQVFGELGDDRLFRGHA